MTAPAEQPDQPHQAKDLFLDLLDLPRDKRDAELQLRAAGDVGLLAAVRSLLDANDRAGGFLVDPTVGEATVKRGHPSARVGGRHVGPYKLLQVIGEGGFGTVYLAEQESPVRRRVALKVIKVGMDTRSVIARFEAERQALALMEHANIAKVFDAGPTADGRPYFVMELVKGVPVTEFCDQKKLDIRGRLDLFAQICHAVQHAHQKGLIHRDIKPSNVLVGDGDDGRPLVKVIDFGIAKATQARLTEKTLFAEFRQLIGTPEYMSPEQAEGSLDIDTRTDVYALGVLLYELLCGATPFDARDLRSKAYGEMQRVIREVDPPRPSTRLSALRDSLPGVAAQRAVEPRRLRSLIRGDLDWIVMKALEKDRARRYETANGLAADVMRYLADEPVLAGPPGKAYRVRKFVRRNRGAVGAGAAILAVLVVALAVTTRLYVRESQALRRAVAAEAEARRQRDEAVSARDAEAEARALTKQADDFVRGMFQAIDPAEARGKPVLVRDVLDQAVSRIDTALVGRPQVQGQMRRFFGNTYLSLGLGAKARDQHELADRLLFAAAGERDAEYVLNLADLGRAYQYLGDPAEALKLYRRAVELGGEALGRDDQFFYSVKSHLAGLLMRQNKLDEASRLYDEILRFRTAELGVDHQQTIATVGDVAWLRQLQGRFAESEQMLDAVLPAARQAMGDDHPKVMALMNSLAQAQVDNGKPDEAERTLRAVVEGTLRVYGPDHRNTLMAAGMHAKVLARLGRLEEARVELVESIDRLRRTLGDGHATTLTNRIQLAQVLTSLGLLDEADREIADVPGQIARTSGADHPEELMALSLRAQIAARRKDHAAAELMYRALLPRMAKVLGPRHPATSAAAVWLGHVLGQQNRWPEAEPILANAYADAARAGVTRAQAVYAVGFGECLARLGKTAQAEPVLRDAEATLRRAARPEPALQARLADAMALIGMFPASTTAPATAPAAAPTTQR